MDGTIYTPPIGNSILLGITRGYAMTLAAEMGYPIVEQQISREQLYIADEIFFTGTAAEITPVKSVDGQPVGPGIRGPVTKAIQERFFGILTGEQEDTYGWLTLINN
jgi:branched-chain amino acid aminotransferase